MDLVRWASRAAPLARAHGLLLIAMALGSCRDRDAAKATPSSAPLAPVAPGAVAAPPSAPVPIEGLEAVDLPPVRDVVTRWAGDKAAGRFVVEATESFGAGPALAVRAESRGAPCRATIWLLEIPGDLARTLSSAPIAVSAIGARSLGDDCCGGSSCERRPALGWMIHLLHVVSSEGNEREARLLGSSGLSVLTQCRGEGCIDAGTSHVAVSAGSVDARTLREAIGGLGLRDNIQCDEDGEAFSCRAHGGGFEGSFTWKRVGRRAVLIEIRTTGH